MQPLFSKSILPFYKKHTTFLKRGRMVVFELLLNRCWKQCIHPKIDTVVFKKTLDVFEKTFDVSKKSARITHGNKQVKAVMTEAAWAATRTKNTFFSERYHRIAARRGKKRALIAVGHSQLISVYLILSTGARYHELGAQYMRAKIEQKRKVYLSSELKKLRYQVALTKAPLDAVPN